MRLLKLAVIGFLYLGLTGFTLPVSDGQCPPGFKHTYNEQTKKHCCNKNVECPRGFHFSLDCGNGSANSIGFCCKKHPTGCQQVEGCSFVQTAAGGRCCVTEPGTNQCKSDCLVPVHPENGKCCRGAAN